jgi:uncharacterized membrane protein YkoI
MHNTRSAAESHLRIQEPPSVPAAWAPKAFGNPKRAFMTYSMRRAYAKPHSTPQSELMMLKRLTLLIAALGMTVVSAAADARPRDREQDVAFRGAQEGRFLSLREIESRIIPRMRGADYLGPELDPGSARYRLKFMRGGQVIWVDVDARSGRVVDFSGR